MLELAAVAVQRQHTFLAAKYILDAMKLLQTSAIWMPTKPFAAEQPAVTKPYVTYLPHFEGS